MYGFCEILMEILVKIIAGPKVYFRFSRIQRDGLTFRLPFFAAVVQHTNHKNDH